MVLQTMCNNDVQCFCNAHSVHDYYSHSGICEQGTFLVKNPVDILYLCLVSSLQTSFWVVREILNEPLAKARGDLITQFIKISKVIIDPSISIFREIRVINLELHYTLSEFIAASNSGGSM